MDRVFITVSGTAADVRVAPPDLRPDEVQQAYRLVAAALTPEVRELRLRLDQVTSNDFCILAFVKSCGNLCRAGNIAVQCETADIALQKVLERLDLTAAKTRPEPTSLFVSIGAAMFDVAGGIRAIIGFLGEMAVDMVYLVRHPKKIPFKETLYYLDRTGADAVPIVALICFLMGLILGFQGIAQMSQFGISIYVADLVGLGIVRELGPLMVAMICTGRAGSAFAAEIGTMKVSEEIDAINTMGLSPVRLLVVPKMLALVLSMPFLTVIGDIVGITGGLIIAVMTSDVTVTQFYNRILAAVLPENLMEGLIKSVVFGVLVAGVGCLRGLEAGSDAKGVGRATTSSVVSGIFLIVVADAFITFTYPLLVTFLRGLCQ